MVLIMDWGVLTQAGPFRTLEEAETRARSAFPDRRLTMKRDYLNGGLCDLTERGWIRIMGKREAERFLEAR